MDIPQAFFFILAVRLILSKILYICKALLLNKVIIYLTIGTANFVYFGTLIMPQILFICTALPF